MINRVARRGGADAIEYGALRVRIESLLDSINKEAQAEPLLAMQANKLEMPIAFFIDSIIAESSLRCAPEWHRNRLAYARNELSGDEKFFDLLDETLNEQTREATDRLMVYYACLGLGFTGWYSGQPEYLRKKMETIAKRIPSAGNLRDLDRICPEAYGFLDTRNLIEPPSSKIGAIAIAFLSLSVVAVAVNFYLFKLASLGLTESLQAILRHDLMK